MKRGLMWACIVLGVIGCISLGFNLKSSLAQEEEKGESFSGVMPFFTTGGYFGFFDQKDGTVYVYDEHMEQVKYVYKLKKLGSEGIAVLDDRGIKNLETYSPSY